MTWWRMQFDDDHVTELDIERANRVRLMLQLDMQHRREVITFCISVAAVLFVSIVSFRAGFHAGETASITKLMELHRDAHVFIPNYEYPNEPSQLVHHNHEGENEDGKD